MNLTKGVIYSYWILVVGLLISALGCYKEDFTTTSSAKLRFSTDTLRFDTVFTRVGSATRHFKIYNDATKALKISSIKVKGASKSVFRLNVDGFPAPSLELKDVEILAQDSIYLFMEVTINPDQPLSISPFVIEDEILFSTNGNDQSVKVEAWGQNANYIPSTTAQGSIALLSCNLQEETWDDPKPYVIYGVLLIDSCTLRIPAGARIYVHGGLARNSQSIYNDGIIYVLNRGRLSVEGTLQNPVLFRSDRLEPELKGEWGAWAGIRLGPGSKNNRITYADIQSPIVGVYADSASELTIRNSRIYNTAGAGILAVHAAVTAENCLIHSTGSFGMQMVYGGVYRVDYCTIANYGNEDEAISINNFLVRNLETNDISPYPLTASFTNNIFTGSGDDEFDMTDIYASKKPESFNVTFTNNYIKVKELLDPKAYPKFFDSCAGCIQAKNSDTVFLKLEKLDFRLDTLSKVNNKAKYIERVPIDILGVRRDPSQPDMGCFELK